MATTPCESWFTVSPDSPIPMLIAMPMQCTKASLAYRCRQSWQAHVACSRVQERGGLAKIAVHHVVVVIIVRCAGRGCVGVWGHLSILGRR